MRWPTLKQQDQPVHQHMHTVNISRGACGAVGSVCGHSGRSKRKYLKGKPTASSPEEVCLGVLLFLCVCECRFL